MPSKLQGIRVCALALGLVAAVSARGAAQEDRALPALPSNPGPSMGVAAPVAPPAGAQPLYYTMPSNGGLLIIDQTHSPNLKVEVKDLQGNVLPGTVAVIDSFAVWRPTLPLPPGSYSVGLPQNGSTSLVTYSFTVTDSATFARPMLTTKLDVQRTERLDSQECCTRITPGLPSMCFATNKSTFVNLSVSVSPNMPGPDLQQYLFKFSAPGFTSMSLYGALPNNYGPYPSQMEQANYCFSLSAINVATGQTYNYDDLRPLCVSGSKIGALDAQPIEVGALQLGAAVCQVPPKWHLEQWCVLNGPTCSANRSTPGCEYYGAGCLGEPLPMPSMTQTTTPAFAGTSGMRMAPVAGSVSTTTTTATNAGREGLMQPVVPPVALNAGSSAGAAGAGDSTPQPVHVKACSAVRVSGSAGYAWVAWALALGVLAVRRRKASNS